MSNAKNETSLPEHSFATVGAVYDDGVTLRFDGEDAVGEKRYAQNLLCSFQPGQRVRVLRDGDTYVVEYPVGVRGPVSSGQMDARSYRAVRVCDAAYAGSKGTDIQLRIIGGYLYFRAVASSTFTKLANG